MKKFRKDIILVSGILLAAFLTWLISAMFGQNAPAQASVYQDGQKIGSYPLTEDISISIPHRDSGGYNLLSIEKGGAFISDADCPDRLCVKQRAINGNGESIICLPHKLVIQIESGKERELDALTY